MKDGTPEFGGNLSRLRKSKGLTQAELAKHIGISLAMIKYYELRAKNPSIAIIQKMAATLEVSVNDLLYGQSKNKPGPESAIENRFKQVAQLPRKQQGKILAVIDAMLASP